MKSIAEELNMEVTKGLKKVEHRFLEQNHVIDSIVSGVDIWNDNSLEAKIIKAYGKEKNAASASTQHNYKRLVKIAKRMQKRGKTERIANYYLIAANGFIEKDSKLTKLMNIGKVVSGLEHHAC